MLCKRKVTDDILETIQNNVRKNVEKTRAKIDELKLQHDPESDIDTTPIIKQIENFLSEAEKNMRALSE